MKYNTLFELYKGKTISRISMEKRLIGIPLYGKVVDIGGGGQTYLKYMNTGDAFIENVDQSAKKAKVNVNFEKDSLPYEDESLDGVMAFNVLEHIYNHLFLMREMGRVVRKGGTIIGHVPFIHKYHPDPGDYYRFTKESLRKMISEEGRFVEINIEPTGRGPFTAAFHMMTSSIPKIMRPIIFPIFYLFDSIFFMFRPHRRGDYTLGYYFEAKKPI